MPRPYFVVIFSYISSGKQKTKPMPCLGQAPKPPDAGFFLGMPCDSVVIPQYVTGFNVGFVSLNLVRMAVCQKQYLPFTISLHLKLL